MRRAFLFYLAASAVLYGLLFACEQVTNEVLRTILYGLAYLLPIAIALTLGKRREDYEPLLAEPLRLSKRGAIGTAVLLPLTLAVLLPVALLGAWLFPAEGADTEVALTLPLVLRHAVLCPLVEECFFRLVPLRLFGKGETRVAWLLSTGAFALFHAAPSRLLHAALAATLFFFIDRLLESVAPSVLFHLANNVTALLIGAASGAVWLVPTLTVLLAVTSAGSLLLLLFHRAEIKEALKSKQLFT